MAKKQYGDIELKAGAKITSEASAPPGPNDLVTKAYVDALSAGLDPKASVRAASTVDIAGTFSSGSPAGVGTTLTLTGSPTFSLTLDDIEVVDGNRVLLKDQTDAKQNGIYVVSGVGSGVVLTRATDQDGSPGSEVSGGNFTFIEQGTTQASQGYVVVADGLVNPDVDDMNWTQFSGTIGGGETNTASNVGAGSGWFKGKVGVDLEFKSLVAGSTKLSVTPNTNDLTVDVAQGNIDHDLLSNFVSNEHIDHSTVSISTQHSLTGGGDITTTRTLNLVNDVASPGNDKLYGTNGSGTRGWYDQPTGGGISGIIVEDEGIAGSPSIFTTLNFTGAGVTATDAGGGEVTINIPGGGGSGSLTNASYDITAQAYGVIGSTAPERILHFVAVSPFRILGDTNIHKAHAVTGPGTSNATFTVYHESTPGSPPATAIGTVTFTTGGGSNQSVSFTTTSGGSPTDVDVVAGDIIYIDYTTPDDGTLADVMISLAAIDTDVTGGSGGGTPGGADTQIQFNDNGSFGGSSNLTWDDNTLTVTAGGSPEIAIIANGDVEINSQIRASNGTFSIPTYSFGLDSDTGMYRSALNELSFVNGGTLSLSIESNGTLHVNPTLNYETLVTDDDDIPNKKYVDDAISAIPPSTSSFTDLTDTPSTLTPGRYLQAAGSPVVLTETQLPYDLSGSVVGVPGIGTIVWRFAVPRPIVLTTVGFAYNDPSTPATVAPGVFELHHLTPGGTSFIPGVPGPTGIATITYSPGAPPHTGVVAFLPGSPITPVLVAPPDELIVVYAIPDGGGTLGNVSFTFEGLI